MNSIEALAGSAGLAGVQWLLSGDEPQAALRDTLAALLDDPTLLIGCRLYRAKYKPGRHLTAYYEASVRDPAGGPDRIRHVEAIWLPAGAADPHGEPAAQTEMEQEARQRGLAAPFHGLRAAEPAWGLWLRVSPLDSDFSQLARLSDPAHLRATLEADYTAAVVRYRPGQRHVLRLDPAGSSEPGPGTLFAKIYNSDKGQRSFGVINTVADWLAAQGADLSTVRPQGYLPAEQTVLYPWVAGTPLSQLLREPGPATDAQVERAGAALRTLHGTPLDLIALQPHSLAKELKGVRSASEHVQALLPETDALIKAILARAEALHGQLSQEPPGFAYGDYKSDHLWVGPGALTLIDFDTCYLFDPAIDVGKFLSDLRWWHDQYGLADVERAQASFLAGYAPEAGRLERGRLYEVLVLVKTTVRRVKLFEADWAERTARLIATADRLLHELEAAHSVRA